MKRIVALMLAMALLFWLGWSMIFIVDQREYAVVSSFGSLDHGLSKGFANSFFNVKRTIVEPGPQIKLPFPFERVARLDKRIQTINYADENGYALADVPNLLITSMIQWRIAEPRTYFTRFDATGVLDAAGIADTAAQNKLTQIIHAALSRELAKTTLAKLLSSDQPTMLAAVREQSARALSEYGVELIDLRLTRIDLPAAATEAVYQQMQAEQQQMLTQLRSSGVEQAQKIRVDAERQRQDILALAYQKTQSLKGEGEAQAASIEAEALQSAPQFYRFFKSLEVYRRSFNGRDVMVVDPSSEFFRFMRRSAATESAVGSKQAK